MGTAQSDGTTGGERYRGFAELSRFPLGDNLELVYAPLTRAAQVLPAFGVRLALGARTFATLDEHVTRLCREFGLPPPQQEAVRVQLTALARAGILVSHGQLVALCRRAPTPAAPARIITVGVPTRNRPAGLRRCLASHVESARRHGRAPEFVVVDDSDKAEVQKENQDALRALAAASGLVLRHAGPREKARFAEALAREAGLPPEDVRFGLLNEEGCSIATGTSRNALLLHAVGDFLLQVDDDTVCRMAPVPGARAGLAFSSQYDPTTFWFCAVGETEPAGVVVEDQDLLAVHEGLLGKDLGECLGPWTAEADVDLNDAGAGFFRRLGAGGGRVRVTAAGVVGDSGMGSAAHFLTLEGESRARLLESEGVYRHALAAHRVLRAVTRATVCDGPLCMALNLGLDNRQLLPPFMPVQRNQDGIFAAALRSCFEGAYVGFLPWAVLHRPQEPRAALSQGPWADLLRINTGQVLQLLVRAIAPGPGRGDGARNLRAAGKALEELAGAPPDDFAEVVRLHLWNQMSRFVSRLENQLRAWGARPDFWADDVRRVLLLLREGLPREEYAIPADLDDGRGLAETRQRLQRLVQRFGRLLQIWPDMLAAARALRVRGVRLAEPVSEPAQA